MQKVTMNNIGGDVIKDNDVYKLKDNSFGNKLVLSSTFLRANQHTNGHKHEGQEEVYQFVSGQGYMDVGEKTFLVNPGDIILIPDGDFHRVYNTSKYEDLIFICVFDGKRYH